MPGIWPTVSAAANRAPAASSDRASALRLCRLADRPLASLHSIPVGTPSLALAALAGLGQACFMSRHSKDIQSGGAKP